MSFGNDSAELRILYPQAVAPVMNTPVNIRASNDVCLNDLFMLLYLPPVSRVFRNSVRIHCNHDSMEFPDTKPGERSLSSATKPVNRNGLTGHETTSKMPSLTYGRSSVIKQDIVNRVAEQLNITKVKAEIAVESVFNSLKNALKRGERIELRGFGVFIVKPRKSGVGRNPRTGEEVAIPPGKTIRFKPGKEIRADKITPGISG